MYKEIFITLLFIIIHSQYNVNLNFPLLLDNSYSNITALKWNDQDAFHVAFSNKQYRRYSFDFSTYTIFNLSVIA